METDELMETQGDNQGNGDGGNKRWYVVHAYSGFEKSVAQALRDRIVRLCMQDRFGDVLVPTEEVVEMRSGQKRRSERKFFPGFVLVQIATHDEAGIRDEVRCVGGRGGPPRPGQPAPLTVADIPANATDVKLTEVSSRNEVFLTAGAPGASRCGCRQAVNRFVVRRGRASRIRCRARP